MIGQNVIEGEDVQVSREECAGGRGYCGDKGA